MVIALNGLALQAMRQGRGWTQSELAERAGISERTIQRAENGDRLRADVIKQIAAALELTPEAFITHLRVEVQAPSSETPTAPGLTTRRSGAIKVNYSTRGCLSHTDAAQFVIKPRRDHLARRWWPGCVTANLVKDEGAALATGLNLLNRAVGLLQPKGWLLRENSQSDDPVSRVELLKITSLVDLQADFRHLIEQDLVVAKWLSECITVTREVPESVGIDLGMDMEWDEPFLGEMTIDVDTYDVRTDKSERDWQDDVERQCASLRKSIPDDLTKQIEMVEYKLRDMRTRLSDWITRAGNAATDDYAQDQIERIIILQKVEFRLQREAPKTT